MLKRKPKIPEQHVINEVGTYTFDKKTLILGFQKGLKQRGINAFAGTPKRKGDPYLLSVGTHINPGSKKFLEAVLHEALHIKNPRMKEQQVMSNAHELGKLLWKIGFRLKDAQ